VSEQQDTDKKDAATPEKAGDDTAAVAPAPATRPAPVQGKGSSPLAWLSLLLAVAVAGALAWLHREQQQNNLALNQRLAALESAAGGDNPALERVQQDLRKQLAQGLGELHDTASTQEQQLTAQARDLQALQARVAEQGAELGRFSANDRGAWLLAETQYLLRLANQRLVMAGDTAAAQALLASADSILRELDDVRLHEVRAAVAADLAAVRAVPKIDVEGIYLRLSALIEQAGKLVIFELPAQEARPAPTPADSWGGRLRQGFEAALTKLSDYIIIRRRDEPVQALMDPQWEGLVRQNLRMLLEQAQVALLSGNQQLYRQSLERADHWVAEFSQSDETAARAMSAEIARLEDMPVAAPLPDISRSVLALDAVMQQRLQPAEAD
jgi:uroporphyrin-3 C-methyltransferase